jgi:pyruvate dehydrogenase E2 component (dihydrolipoamide acetyltransferase)
VARVLRMPEVAASATEAVLGDWLVDESSDFAATDALATVETEKAAVDVEADAAGRVLKTLVPAGTKVEVGDPIAVLGEPGETVPDMEVLLASLGVGVATDVVIPERRDVPAAPEPVAREQAVPKRTEPEPVAPRADSINTTRPTDGRLFASPLARKLAKDAGLRIDDIRGTGPRGRILRRDVDRALASLAADPAPAVAPRPTGVSATYDEVPHSRIRLATARRLTESKQQAPHFYVRATLRAEDLLSVRAEINAGGETRVSVNDLVLKAVAAAHRRVPEMNVAWSADFMRHFHTVDIAVAVATDRGLMTPVVRDVSATTVSDLATAVRDLAERARAGALKQNELEGGSIAITNLGMYGVEEFAAIISPPQAAILAVGAVREEPVVEGGVVVPGVVMTVTLSVDHRAVDGVLAARWLEVLVELLEHPVRLLA